MKPHSQKRITKTPSNFKGRNSHAATLAEFGPALFILLLVFFFPVLDLVSICFAYGVVKVLNNNQVHEASLIPAEKAQDPNGLVKKGIPAQWHDSGLGKFVNVAGRPVTEITYRDGLSGGEASSTGKFVMVKTTVVCNPAVFVPFPILKVPALNSPVPLTVSSERPMEDPENAG